MRRALVTGAGGFLGAHTVQTLADSGWEVERIVRSPTKMKAIVADLEDTSFLSALGGTPRCEAIVHLAARVDWSPDMSAALYRANVHATSAFVTLAQDWKARLVFASSAMVCGTCAESIGAGSAAGPDTPYGQTKWLAEQLIAAAGISSTIFRFGGIFGLGGPAHLGLNRAIAGAAAGTVPTVTGAGSARRNYIYVKDAALAIAHALEKGTSGTHLIAGSETLSIAQWLGQVCRAFLPGASLVSTPGQEACDQIIAPSIAFPPSRSVQDAMADMREAIS